MEDPGDRGWDINRSMGLTIILPSNASRCSDRIVDHVLENGGWWWKAVPRASGIGRQIGLF
jgi:hypothetical protein